MPTIMKDTFIFSGPGRGWTESYYRRSADGNILAEFAVMEAVAPKRAQLLGDGYFIQGLRTSRITDNAEVRGRFGGDVKLTAYFGNAGYDGDFSDSSVLVIAKDATTTKQKAIYLRGVWDPKIGGEGALLTLPAWETDFNTWIGEMIQRQFGWYGQSASGAQGEVLGYTADANDNVTVTTTTDFFPLNLVGTTQVVRVRGVNVKSRLNGQYPVFVTGRSAFRLPKPLALGSFTTPGFVQLLSFAFVQATNYRAQRVVSRKTGNPLFVSRGRAPTRART